MMRIILLNALVAFLTFPVFAQTINGVVEQDYNALVDFYNSTNGDNWNDNTNWLSEQPVSTWFGVGVWNERVTSISLVFNNLTGEIPESISDLSDLYTLQISGPYSSPIPLQSEIFNLDKLTTLNLIHIDFGGSIPDELNNLVGLNELRLSDCNIPGPFPEIIRNFTALRYLRIANDDITGVIPEWIGELSNLYSLELQGNRLSGDIPTSITNLTNLLTLDLSGNQFSGAFPEVLTQLDLRNLNLSSNDFSGDIPHSISNLTSLIALNLGHNDFSGEIFDKLVLLTNLNEINIPYNEFTGVVPPEIENLTNLSFIEISGNEFEGFPDELANLTKLNVLNFYYNEIDNLPDLGDKSMQSIGATNCRLDFGDLEWLVGSAVNYYAISPQSKIGEYQVINAVLGNDYTLSFGEIAGTANTYQWYKYNQWNNPVAISDANTPTFEITNLLEEETGSYLLEVKNSLLPELTLNTSVINVILDNPGDYCETSSPAVVGSNSASSLAWFTYTATELINVSISGPPQFTEVDVFSDCQYTQIWNEWGENLQLDFTMQPGDQVFFRWKQSPSSFEFSFETQDLYPGISCDFPEEIGQGIHTALNGGHWYLIYPEKSGMMTFTSIGLTDVDTKVSYYDTNCNGPYSDISDNYNGLQSRVRYRVYKGSPFKIYWENKDSNESFDWEMSIADIAPGDECYEPIIVTEGIYEVSDFPNWYRYTAPEDVTVTVSSVGLTFEDTHLTVFKECYDQINWNNNVDGTLQSKVSVGLKAGERIHIRWRNYYSSANFQFEISLSKLQDGDACSNPVELQNGTVTGQWIGQWYTFLAPEDGAMVFEREEPDNGIYFRLFSDCNGNELENSYAETRFVRSIEKGERIYLQWYAYDFYEGFTWDFEFRSANQGEVCEFPFEVFEGNVDNAKPDSWYLFKATENATYRFSGVGTSNLGVYGYNQCDGSNDYYYDWIDGQPVLTVEMVPDQPIYLWWDDWTNVQEQFDWKIESNTKSCVNPITTWYYDGDGDGFGDSSTTLDKCYQPFQYVAIEGDCNDSNPEEYPNRRWYVDNDGDGIGHWSNSLNQCSQPPGYVAVDGDCDDNDANITGYNKYYRDEDGDGFGNPNIWYNDCNAQPGYVENDLDCDDSNPDSGSIVVWYKDEDGDGYGDSNVSKNSCLTPLGYVLNAEDCDDSDPNLNPDTIWYVDADSDGYGSTSSTQESCDQPVGFVNNSNDCDDSDPLATVVKTWFADTDGDGYGDPELSQQSCTIPAGFVANSDDCNDQDANITDGLTWYADSDGDGFGDENATLNACTQPEGYVDNASDCDDEDKDVYPEAPAKADGKDNDCDGVVDKLSQSITFESISDKNEGDSFELEAASDSGLDVLYQVTGPAELDGNTLMVTGPGRVTVTATQEGSEGFKGADEVVQTFCVNPSPEISVADDELNVLTLVSNYETGNKWYKDDVAIEGASGKEYTVGAAGSYTVEVTVDDCPGTSEAFTATVTSVDDLSGMTLEMFPNPFRDVIQIRVSNLPDRELTITITDLQGKIQIRQDYDQVLGNLELETNDLADGIYFVIVQSGDIVIKEKVVKQ